jgi:hypothetical protein
MFTLIRFGVSLVVAVGLAGCGDRKDPSSSPMSGPLAPTVVAPPERSPITLSVTRGTTRGGTGINLTAAEFTGAVLQQVRLSRLVQQRSGRTLTLSTRTLASSSILLRIPLVWLT